MFRRFMIVCWAVFTLSAVTAAAGWYLAFEADRQREVAQLEIDALSWNAESLADELFAKGKDKSELSDNELRALAEGEERRNAEIELAEIDERIGDLVMVAVYGTFAAIVILLWNLMWHVGHWIWRGRENAVH